MSEPQATVVASNSLLDLECSQVAGLTRTKTEFLLAQHKALIGFIVMDINDGARHYIDAGDVRRLSCEEAYAFMKPESNPTVDHRPTGKGENE